MRVQAEQGAEARVRAAEERAQRAETRCTQLTREAEALREELAAARRHAGELRRQVTPRELRQPVRDTFRCMGATSLCRPVYIWLRVFEHSSTSCYGIGGERGGALQSMHARTAPPALLAPVLSQSSAQGQALLHSGLLSGVDPP